MFYDRTFDWISRQMLKARNYNLEINVLFICSNLVVNFLSPATTTLQHDYAAASGEVVKAKILTYAGST
jgi:hypothetical protein